MSRRVVPNERDHEVIDRKVAKLITTIIEAADDAWRTRCEAMMIKSGCKIEISRKMRLLHRAEEL